MDNITLFHGSSKIVQEPFLGGGNAHNDYGPGFYCSQNLELAKEWACKDLTAGAFVNHYSLEPSFKLHHHNLSEEGHILNWLAVLLNNRNFSISSRFALQAKEYILNTFLPDLTPYDLVSGYRADDSYFSFANLFLHNGLSLSQLEKAMHLGQLGQQIVIMSKKAFEALTFVSAEPVEKEIYYAKRLSRDRKARADFQKEKNLTDETKGIYMIDILREQWKNDDPRLR